MSRPGDFGPRVARVLTGEPVASPEPVVGRTIVGVRWLSWRWGVGGAAAGVACWWLLAHISRPSDLIRLARSTAREFALVSGLYAIWNLGGRIEAFGADRALERGAQLWEIQQRLGLPSEAWLQDMILPHGWLVQSANVYYAVAHVPGMIGALLWMFYRHSDHYRSFRTQMALFTGTSLLIQLVAVAPPRFVDATGMVDTGILYGQSVYTALGRDSVGQLQAMPSIHVGWALFVGVATYRFASNPWVRWAGVTHVVLTMWVVMVTANHFWLDGIAAAVIMAGWYVVLHARDLLAVSLEARRTHLEPIAGRSVEVGAAAAVTEDSC